MSSLTAIVARNTAATAGVGSDPAVQQDAIPSALRQLRQLRQGCLISCSRPFVGGEKYIRRSRKTLPTQPSLPFYNNIKEVRTAGCRQQPADPAASEGSVKSSQCPPRSSPRWRGFLPADTTPRCRSNDYRTITICRCRRHSSSTTAPAFSPPTARLTLAVPGLLPSNPNTPSHHRAPSAGHVRCCHGYMVRGPARDGALRQHLTVTPRLTPAIDTIRAVSVSGSPQGARW
jgi:hypothetical protein